MTEKAIFYVYVYARPDGRPCYVGKGTGDRWLHRGRSGRNKHFIRIRDQAAADGLELPRMKIMEALTSEEALYWERFFIAAIGREVDGGPLVNLSVGGDQGPIGYKWPPEQNAKNPRFRGHSHSPAARAALSAALKEKPKSPEHAAKAGAAKKGKEWVPPPEHVEHLRRLAESKPHLGIRHSEETRAKIRAARVRQDEGPLKATQFKPGQVPWNKGRKLPIQQENI